MPENHPIFQQIKEDIDFIASTVPNFSNYENWSLPISFEVSDEEIFVNVFVDSRTARYWGAMRSFVAYALRRNGFDIPVFMKGMDHVSQSVYMEP